MQEYQMRNYRTFGIGSVIILLLNIPLCVYLFYDLIVEYNTEWFLVLIGVVCELLLYIEIIIIIWWVASTKVIIDENQITLRAFRKSNRISFDEINRIKYKWKSVLITSKSGNKIAVRRDIVNFNEISRIIESRAPSTVIKTHSLFARKS